MLTIIVRELAFNLNNLGNHFKSQINLIKYHQHHHNRRRFPLCLDPNHRELQGQIRLQHAHQFQLGHTERHSHQLTLHQQFDREVLC